MQPLEGLLKWNKLFNKYKQVVIWSDQGNEWIYGSVIKYTQLFSSFWKQSIEDRVKH